MTTEEIEGSPKAPAVEIEADGKTQTLLIPGKLVGKRWVVDPGAMREVHILKPGTEVKFVTDGDADKPLLLDIAKVPGSKPAKLSATSKPAGDKKMQEKDQDRDKDKAKEKDSK